MKKILALLLSIAMLVIPMTAFAETSVVEMKQVDKIVEGNEFVVDYISDTVTIKGVFDTEDNAEDRLATLIVLEKGKTFSEENLKADPNLIKWADQSFVRKVVTEGIEKDVTTIEVDFVIDTFEFGNGEYEFQISTRNVDKKFTGEFNYSDVEMEAALVAKINNTLKGGMNELITKTAKTRIEALDATVVADYVALKDTAAVDKAMAEKNDFASLADFVGALRTEVDAQKEAEKDAPAGSNGGGGGGNGGGGSSSSGKDPIAGGGSVAGGASAELVAQPSGNPFLDIGNSYWGKDAIVNLYNKGIVKGQGNGYFRPDNTITRAEFVQMVVVAFGFEMMGDAANFADVADSDWFANAVQVAFANGVVNGTSATTFSPLSNITRQDMMTILYNAAKAKGVNLTMGSAGFTDADYISGYAQDAVAAMVGSNVVSGYTDGSVKPLNNASRAEAAAMLSRLLEVK